MTEAATGPATEAVTRPVTEPAAAPLRPVSVNLLGVVEHPVLGDSPYRIDADGRPYVPAGDGGIVLGLRLGDSAFSRDGDHAAPGACLVHQDTASRYALTVYSCIGNEAQVRTGLAAGVRGVVIGKRGEEGRVIAAFAQADLARLRPSDQVAVRSCGQGWRPGWLPPGVTMLNLDPAVVRSLPISVPRAGEQRLSIEVASVFGSAVAGNGIGRPAVGWDLDLQLVPPAAGGRDVLLGDLVAVSGIDARFNMGYRSGWVTVGIIGHGSSPLPGHGPGLTPILTGQAGVLEVTPAASGHVGLTEPMLKLQ